MYMKFIKHKVTIYLFMKGKKKKIKKIIRCNRLRSVTCKKEKPIWHSKNLKYLRLL